MYNQKLLKETREKYKDADKRHSKGMKEFEFMTPLDLDQGDYYIRLFPKNPVSNPTGFRIVGSHFLEGNINETNANGDVKKKKVDCSGTDGPDSKCYFCDVYKALEEEGFFDNPKADQGVVKAAGNLSPAIEHWFLISLMAERREEKNGEWTNVKYKPTDFSGEYEHGKILKVKQQSIVDDIFACIAAGKKDGLDLTEADEQGGYLILSKRANGYEVKLAEDEYLEIPLQNADLMAKYPRTFKTMGNKSRMSPVQGQAFLENKESCWWGNYLKKFVDISADGDDDVADDDDDSLDGDLD